MTPRLAPLLVVGALLVAAACTGGDDDPTATPSSTSTATSAPPSEPTGSATLPEAIPDVTPALRLDQALEGQRGIPGQPDWLVAVDGLIWAKRDDGTVSAIDPRLDGTVADVATGYSSQPTCQGLAYDGEKLWTCAGPGAMVTIDPRTREAGEPIAVARHNDQSQYPVAAGQIWIIDASARVLKGLSLEDGAVVTTVRLGGFCADLARAPNDAPGLFVLCPTDGRVLQVDPTSGEIVGELAIDLPQVGALADDLWVGFDGGLAQVSTEDLSVTAVYAIDVGITGGIEATPDEVWVKDASGRAISRIDPAEKRFVVTVKGPVLGVGDLIVVGDTLWTTNSDESLLFELSAPQD